MKAGRIVIQRRTDMKRSMMQIYMNGHIEVAELDICGHILAISEAKDSID